ncbi:MAG: diacylglycerol kinase family lipid kinase [Clostridia bacterium]|nr:diacylglycerol kinase family lipid kinase [Clostridia bacterium]
MKKEILLIVNPCSGKGNVSKYIPQICDNLEKQGYELEVIYTSKTNNGKQIIENYIRYIDAVVVCGGDGTLNEVINGIIKCHKKIDVTFIPFGTTNDFARTVNVPRSHYKLSRKLSKYREIGTDIGSFNDRFFYYVAAFGTCTNVSYSTDQKDKNKYGKLAYYKKGIQELKKMKSYQVSIVTDNEIIKDEFIYGAITNSISIGSFKWFKRNEFKVNDGKFELILIKKPKNFIGLIKIFMSILRKKYDQKNIYYLKTKHLQIDFDRSVDWTLDGEFGGGVSHAIIENHKNKIDLLVPINKKK